MCHCRFPKAYPFWLAGLRNWQAKKGSRNCIEQSLTFDKQAAALRREQDGLLRKIQDIEKATPAPVDQAIDMLRLTSRASELFLQQSALEQRRFLQTVVAKAAWKEGALHTSLFEPFEILRHSNQESSRNEKENAGSRPALGIWLLR